MICDHCDQPIEGTPREIPVDSPTGAAPNVFLCPEPCRPAVPRQTTQVSLSR